MTRTISIEGSCLIGGRIAPSRVAVRDGLCDPGSSGDAVWRLARDEILIPAFQDHHTHLIGTFRPPQGPDLGGSTTRQECLDRVERWLRDHPGTAPIVAEGWDQSDWDDPRLPTRAEIDRVSARRPIAMRRVCGHMAVVNSAAWDRIRPSGAEADRVTGILTESYALGIPARWPPTPEDLIEGARKGQEAAARAGVVAVDEMARAEQWRAFRRLEDEGGLWLRVNHAFPLDSLESLASDGISAGSGGARVRAAGLKGFLDGSIGARTAAIGGSYLDHDGAGMLLWEEGRLADAVRRGSRAGFAIRLHAIGARAIALALGAFEQAAAAASGEPHRVEHAEELDPDLIARAARAGIAFSMQPNFTVRWQQPGGLYDRALGPDRARRLNPYRAVAAATPLLFGSDTMPFGPLFGLAGAVAHPDPAERLSAVEAIAAYAAGPIAAGRSADLVVLRVPGGDLAASLSSGTARVRWTAAQGRTVWRDPSAEIPDAFLEGSAV